MAFEGVMEVAGAGDVETPDDMQRRWLWQEKVHALSLVVLASAVTMLVVVAESAGTTCSVTTRATVSTPLGKRCSAASREEKLAACRGVVLNFVDAAYVNADGGWQPVDMSNRTDSLGALACANDNVVCTSWDHMEIGEPEMGLWNDLCMGDFEPWQTFWLGQMGLLLVVFGTEVLFQAATRVALARVTEAAVTAKMQALQAWTGGSADDLVDGYVAQAQEHYGYSLATDSHEVASMSRVRARVHNFMQKATVVRFRALFEVASRRRWHKVTAWCSFAGWILMSIAGVVIPCVYSCFAFGDCAPAWSDSWLPSANQFACSVGVISGDDGSGTPRVVWCSVPNGFHFSALFYSALVASVLLAVTRCTMLTVSGYITLPRSSSDLVRHRSHFGSPFRNSVLLDQLPLEDGWLAKSLRGSQRALVLGATLGRVSEVCDRSLAARAPKLAHLPAWQERPSFDVLARTHDDARHQHVVLLVWSMLLDVVPLRGDFFGMNLRDAIEVAFLALLAHDPTLTRESDVSLIISQGIRALVYEYVAASASRHRARHATDGASAAAGPLAESAGPGDAVMPGFDDERIRVLVDAASKRQRGVSRATRDALNCGAVLSPAGDSWRWGDARSRRDAQRISAAVQQVTPPAGSAVADADIDAAIASVDDINLIEDADLRRAKQLRDSWID